MKKHIRMLVLFAVCTIVLCAAAFAAGTSYTKQLTASYVGITLVVDGETVTPKDANGNDVDPFIVDGTTYLPVRAVAEAFGKEVEWDGNSKTVYIGKKKTESQQDEQTVKVSPGINLLKVGENYNMLYKRGFSDDLDDIWYFTMGDLVFAKDVDSSGPIRPLTFKLPVVCALTEKYITEDSENPYFEYISDYILKPGFEKVWDNTGIEETIWYSPTESYTPVWWEVNGYRLYNFNPYEEYETDELVVSVSEYRSLKKTRKALYDGRIVIQNGIRYLEVDNAYYPCMNDIFKAFGIDKTISFGEYEGIGFMCIE